MIRIFPKKHYFTIPLFLILQCFSAFASLSVFTEGKPRLYVLDKGQVESLSKESHSNVVLQEFNLLFEGADLKKGEISLKNDPKVKSVQITKAKIKSDDGTFQCTGKVEVPNVGKKDITFFLSLDPIKNGFKFEMKLKDYQLNLKGTLKKR